MDKLVICHNVTWNLGPISGHGLTSIPAWISNHMPSKCSMKLHIQMYKQLHPKLHNGCNYLSMMGSKLIHVSKMALTGGAEFMLAAYRECKIGEKTHKIGEKTHRFSLVLEFKTKQNILPIIFGDKIYGTLYYNTFGIDLIRLSFLHWLWAVR